MICHLKTILAILDISQLEISEDIDISRNTITAWTRHGTPPRLDTAYEVRDYINKAAERKGIPNRWTVEQIWEKSP
jgi:DNA-binding XRE family transcriptional regulator